MLILLGMHGKILYYDLIAWIERMSELSHFILVKVSVVGIFQPYIFITIVNYFFFDLKNQSFYLPYPVV